jgi:L-fuculose-phosphate aldolase
VLPEVEVFLGDVPITKYETPGGKQFAETILPFVSKTNVMILANHGTVSYGVDVEQAYWWTEILDAYCRMLMLARSLGKINYFSEDKERELLDLKQKWGWSDPRNTDEYKNCDICANDIFRGTWQQSGVERRAFEAPPPMGPQSTKAGSSASSSGASSNGKSGSIPTFTSNGSMNGAKSTGTNAAVASEVAKAVSSVQANGVDTETLIKLITDRVMQSLASK